MTDDIIDGGTPSDSGPQSIDGGSPSASYSGTYDGGQLTPAGTAVLVGTGELSFNNGTATLATPYWALGYSNSQRFNFSNGGAATIYALNPVFALADGSYVIGGKGRANLYWYALAAFKDFAIYTSADPRSGGVVLTSDGNVNSGNVGSPWARHYKTFIPPVGTAFLVPHVQFQSVPTGTYQYLDTNQMEMLPVGTSTVSTFATARAVTVSVRPVAINYVTNPNGVNNTTDWTNAAQTPSGLKPSTGTSLSVTVHSMDPGTTYIASARVWGNTQPVTFSGLTTNSSQNSDGSTLIWATFVPTLTDWTITLTSTSTFNVNQAMVNQGSILKPYFDGNSGLDYLWENGGTPNNCKSYYYPGRTNRQYVLIRNLEENMPLGLAFNETITYASPTTAHP